ncbi:MAG: hypothetical protein COA58_06795 [Bacteroidetes bacterium]|nr:MAG: hypothetical protein COA58_06795 [Bacteroidota bacterium]
MSKSKTLFSGIIIILFFAFGSLFTGTEESIVSEIDEMEMALEEHFNCEINGSFYYIMFNHHRLNFTLALESTSKLTTQEAQMYLSSKFENFDLVDDFEIL